MAKQGMKRPGSNEPHKRKNDEDSVPEIQGKAKNGHVKANPIDSYAPWLVDHKKDYKE